MAFVMVLGALTILTVMLTEVQDQSSAELSSALEARDQLLAEYAARSAINLSRLLIASEPTIRKSVSFLGLMFGGQLPQLPVWVYSDRLLGPFNDSSGAESFSSFSGIDLSKGKNLGFPGASFEVAIVDEDSKLNINSAGSAFAQRRLMMQLMERMTGPQYDPLFENRDADGNFSDRQAICAALIDWVDGNQDTMACDRTNYNAQDMPAEDSYYELLRKPYHRKNAPFDSLEEIRRVRGVSDDFWSTFIDPDPDHPEKRLFTVWGQNTININTAQPLTLLKTVCSTLPQNQPVPKMCIDPMEQAKIFTMFGLIQTLMPGVPPFGSPQAFAGILSGKGNSAFAGLAQTLGLEPVTLDANALSQLSVESKVFSIYATGIVKSGRRETHARIHAVVDFRGAPAPGVVNVNGWGEFPGQAGLGTGGTAALPTATGGTMGVAAATGSGGAAAMPGITGATRPSPGGNVIYYRMD